MPIDEKARKTRAIKAAYALSAIRKKRTQDRDKGIVFAFDYLSNNEQSIYAKNQGIAFLIENSGGAELLDGETVLRKLADATGLTRERIRQIVNKSKM